MEIRYHWSMGRQIRKCSGDPRCSHPDVAKLIQGHLDERPATDLEQSLISPHTRTAAASEHKPLNATVHNTVLTAKIQLNPPRK
jgi:hypothetical protein